MERHGDRRPRRGGPCFDDATYTVATARAATFVLEHLRDHGGRLLRSWRNGMTGGPGFADDYALMASACLTLYETTFELRPGSSARASWPTRCRALRGRAAGGFFQTGSDAETLLVRPKELYDNATPSGNSMAADVLLRLARFTSDAEHERPCHRGVRLVADALDRAPGAFGHALCALDRLLGPGREVAVVGEAGAADTEALVDDRRAPIPAQPLARGDRSPTTMRRGGRSRCCEPHDARGRRDRLRL